MKDLNIKGNVIDVAAKGNTIISEIASKALMETTNICDKDFIAWNKKSIPSEEKVYDYAIAFFSLNTIGNKYRLVKILRELKRVLKKDGRIVIWDAYGLDIKPSVTYQLKVLISEGDIRKVKYKVVFNPFRIGFNGVMKTLQKNGFEILNSRIMDNVYYIEAENAKERK
jgi:ubiquinone/menaquinone biosynthesis C-methylase UbiE